MNKWVIVGLFCLLLPTILAYTNVVDLGTVPSHSPATLPVTLPDDFQMVEMAHYEASNPDQVAKYMGWNGYLKVDDNLVWNVKSTTPNEVAVFDRTLGQVVDASSGVGSWLDATKFFKAGTNKVEFYHENQGEIGVKVRITSVTAEEAKQESKSTWGFGFDVKKSAGGRCDTNTECKSAHCERHVCCEAGKKCCSSDGECASFICDDHYYYCVDKQGAVQPSTSAPPSEDASPLVDEKVGTNPVQTCNGCTWQDGCFPVGKQLQVDNVEKYCSSSGWLTVKFEGEPCAQYYECASQGCAKGVCVVSDGSQAAVSSNSNQSGWDYFIAWLKSIFG